MLMDRIKHLDVLKFFAIYLVVLGHSIQVVEKDFMHNVLFEFIYSFHMPLFAFLSGYFAFHSLNDSAIEFVKKRSTQLLLPVLSWSVITLSVSILIDRPEHYMGVIKPHLMYQLWFLKCMWVCSIVTFFFFKYVKNQTCSYILFLLFCMAICMLPEIGDFCWINFLLPIYGAGLAYSKAYNRMINPFGGGKNLYILFLSLIIFGSLYSFWSGDKTIYVTTISYIKNATLDLDNILVSILRWSLGLSAAIVLFCLSPWISSRFSEKVQKQMSNIGKRTLGIYVIQGLCFNVLESMNMFSMLSCDNEMIKYVLVFLLSIVITFISYFCTCFLERHPYSALLFLGKRMRMR